MAKKRAATGQEAPAKKTAAKKVAKAAKPATEKKAVKAVKSAAAAPKAAAPKKKVAAVKLNDKQKDLLSKIKVAGETGFEPNKDEKRGIAGLHLKKLVKKSVDKETKVARYMLTKVGEKALSSTSTPTS